jgi:hypothetical protein
MEGKHDWIVWKAYLERFLTLLESNGTFRITGFALFSFFLAAQLRVATPVRGRSKS